MTCFYKLKYLKKILIYYFLFNIRIYIKNRIFKNNNNLLNLKKIKNLHKGQRCFIVANGPSLQVKDIEKLCNEITFTMNSIFMLKNKTSWKSTYYCCCDDFHFRKMIELYKDDINNVCSSFKFINKKSEQAIRTNGISIDSSIFLDISDINSLLSSDAKEKFYFRKDLTKGIYNCGTVTNVAIIIAMYMGIKEIYLLGVDCNYKTKEKHFELDWNDRSMTINQQEIVENRMRNGFKEISKIANFLGVKIYNATRGGMLEEFERIDFDKIEL